MLPVMACVCCGCMQTAARCRSQAGALRARVPATSSSDGHRECTARTIEGPFAVWGCVHGPFPLYPAPCFPITCTPQITKTLMECQQTEAAWVHFFEVRNRPAGSHHGGEYGGEARCDGLRDAAGVPQLKSMAQTTAIAAAWLPPGHFAGPRLLSLNDSGDGNPQCNGDGPGSKPPGSTMPSIFL